MKYISHIVCSLLLALAFSCKTEQPKLSDLEEYTGPGFESTGVQVIMSDSTFLKVQLTGNKQVQHRNGDLEFPEGIKVVFYNKAGEPISQITAQEGYKAAEENVYRARGDVVVQDLVEKKTLSTEELYWNPDEKTIYTDKFVTIETAEELVLAEGLKAPQDFSTYELINPHDTEFIIKEN